MSPQYFSRDVPTGKSPSVFNIKYFVLFFNDQDDRTFGLTVHQKTFGGRAIPDNLGTLTGNVL